MSAIRFFMMFMTMFCTSVAVAAPVNTACMNHSSNDMKKVDCDKLQGEKKASCLAAPAKADAPAAKTAK
jgi:short subunit fatty acids transporter